MLLRFSVPKDRMARVVLQKQLSSKYRGKTYHKFVVVLPNELIEELGWNAGQTFEAEAIGKSLKLKG